MKHLRKFLEGGVLGLVVLLVFVAAGHPAELKKVTLGYSTVGPAGTGLWMAKEIGAFEKYGIDADLIFISSGPVVVQALIGGDLQAGLAATNAVIAAVLGGAPLVSVMSLVNRPLLPAVGTAGDHPARGVARENPGRFALWLGDGQSDTNSAAEEGTGWRGECAANGRNDGDGGRVPAPANCRRSHFKLASRCPDADARGFG